MTWKHEQTFYRDDYMLVLESNEELYRLRTTLYGPDHDLLGIWVSDPSEEGAAERVIVEDVEEAVDNDKRRRGVI